MCKSVKDPLYGRGEQIEKDMFLRNGHVRHFFSEEFTQQSLGNKFEIVKMWNEFKELKSKNSVFIKVVARKL